MTRLDALRPVTGPLDPFLYSSIGEDRAGGTVTVLSALSRLGLDPREAAADLSALSRDEARVRLDGLLARCGDVPALADDHDALALRLIALLPNTASRKRTPRARPAMSGNLRALVVGLAPLLAVLAVILLLARVLLPDIPGSGY